eukprot:CAMPEP_0170561714 /NCGR_PEP_ID=MMETSP0211-20121228/56488_1 /TAXON_ID=311385 /ORGANISM="Pseudokeronopsis sp., Strain OXSARD2" /LENGTH=56 /DNA_ID=CAMNT_0010877639 /DNA_START=168 /DNA_END=338 /DNA_ORIENTATION=-
MNFYSNVYENNAADTGGVFFIQSAHIMKLDEEIFEFNNAANGRVGYSIATNLEFIM